MPANRFKAGPFSGLYSETEDEFWSVSDLPSADKVDIPLKPPKKNLFSA